jgi:acetyltransferase-like isoleucine patch superfamily enzyme
MGNDLFMQKTIIHKVLFLILNRPTQFFSYLRQTYFFYQTYLLRLFFINGKGQYQLGVNVRLQSLKTLMAGPTSLIVIGNHSILYENAKVEAFGVGEISIGENSIIGDARISCREKITIGDHFLTSWNVFIQDFDSHPVKGALRAAQVQNMTHSFFPSFQVDPMPSAFHFDFPSECISIGNNVWLGANVTILKGAKIGDNCVVATGAVVLKGDYESHSLIAGNPAKVVKTLN